MYFVIAKFCIQQSITCGSVAQLSSVLLLLLFIIINIYKAPYIWDQPVRRRVLLQGFRVSVFPFVQSVG